MKNLKMYLPLVDGSSLPLDFDSGIELIHELVSDDFGPPSVSLQIEAKSKDGRVVRIGIPYSEGNEVSVSIQK